MSSSDSTSDFSPRPSAALIFLKLESAALALALKSEILNLKSSKIPVSLGSRLSGPPRLSLSLYVIYIFVTIFISFNGPSWAMIQSWNSLYRWRHSDFHYCCFTNPLTSIKTDHRRVQRHLHRNVSSPRLRAPLPNCPIHR